MSLFQNMLEKRAQLELQYEAVKNQQGNLFTAPQVKMPHVDKNNDIPQRKLTSSLGKKRMPQGMHHEDKFLNPYGR